MRAFPVILSLILAACNGVFSIGSDEVSLAIDEQDRQKFAHELTILTFRSQCPSIHPAILEQEAMEIENLKSALEAKITESALKEDLVTSHREMDRQNRYSNESDCVGTPIVDDDTEGVAGYRSIFEHEKQQLADLERHFQSLTARKGA